MDLSGFDVDGTEGYFWVFERHCVRLGPSTVTSRTCWDDKRTRGVEGGREGDVLIMQESHADDTCKALDFTADVSREGCGLFI